METTSRDKYGRFIKGCHASHRTEFKQGHGCSQEIKEIISKANKGCIPWNKGKTGVYSEKTLRQISKTQKGINPWINFRNIDDTKRKLSESKLGEQNPMWNGGTSFEPYGLAFNKKFKDMIRARDGYCCIICNKFQKELGYKLHVHHVDYIKINNFPQNCVSVCWPHHSDANTNRTHWTKFFQSPLKERYGYEYTEEQKVIYDFVNNQIKIEA